MKTLLSFLTVSVGVPIAMVAAIARPRIVAPAVVEVTTAAVQVAPSVATVPPEPVAAVSPQMLHTQHLRDYVLGVMGNWPRGSKELLAADYTEVASDIAAAVVVEPKTIEDATGKPCEPRGCFWGSGFNSDSAKSVLLASLAYWEGSRFSAYVDENLCVTKAWRPLHKHEMHLGGDCDGGFAHSLWQIHPFKAKPGEELICDKEHVDASRFGAARCALEIARQSIYDRGDLSRYTGESAFNHPKADERLEFAKAAIKKFPFVE